VRRLSSLVALVLTLTAACSTPPTDGVAPAPPTTAEPTTTTVAPTTTTTVPVPADVADLAATTTMTERARRVFLAASPAIEDPATFAVNCGVDNVPDAPGEPRTHTQGCYVRGRIHLLVPDRAEARGLLYVVAAHELLHAVYASLGASDRTRIDAELQAARAGNERLEERLKPYGSGPTLTNEIHSILGSEFDGLSPTLEAHYAQFFANRSSVVAPPAHPRDPGGRDPQAQGRHRRPRRPHHHPQGRPGGAAGPGRLPGLQRQRGGDQRTDHPLQRPDRRPERLDRGVQRAPGLMRCRPPWTTSGACNSADT